ncbi:MAG: thiamine pyrophosphate-binding protein [Anaerolineae bacterium]
MKASDYITKFISAQQVTRVFELSGGMITHLLDSICRHGGIQLVSMHHEQGAAFAAEGYARMTGIPGVALATSGPGATNLLTGIASCYFDSVPAVFITGQVNRNEQKGQRAIRQLGFQEADIVAMAGPVTKASWRVDSADQLETILTNAFTIALSGRQGPVLVDIPMDCQRAEVSFADPIWVMPTPELYLALNEEWWSNLRQALVVAERPLILVGGGVRTARVVDGFRRLSNQLSIPVVNSLMAVDVLPANDPNRVGLIGTYGNRWANLGLAKSDFLLVLGSRLDIRQTGADTLGFKHGRRIFHVDCDEEELNNRILGCDVAHAGLQEFVAQALEIVPSWSLSDRTLWRSEIEALRLRWPDIEELKGIYGINPNRFMHQLSALSPLTSSYVVDVGQHQLWAAQSIDLTPDQRWLTSGGMGAMGFSLPAAIGVALSGMSKPVVVIVGDGSAQCNIQELETIVRNGLPIKIIVLNNRCLGMVRQFQESYFEGRYQSTVWGYGAPNFTAVAQAYGMEARSVAEPGDVDQAIQWLWDESHRPALLQVMVDTQTNIYPKMAFGKPIGEMEPFAKPLPME